MKTNCKQVSFSDFFEEFNQLVDTKKPMILKYFEDYIDINSLIPHEFYDSYYSSTGRPRDYSLESMISALIFKCFFQYQLFQFLSFFYQYLLNCVKPAALNQYLINLSFQDF